MSISYLELILPIPDVKAEQGDLFQDVSERELGVLMARFETFSSSVAPFKAKLQPIETFLGSFNTEIHNLSESLHSLQQQSSLLADGLDEQRELVDKLNPVILDLMIPPSVAESVLLDTIDELWVENVRFIAEKQQLLARIKADETLLPYKDCKGLEELENGLVLLEAKAIERIRDHLINQIRLLRRSLRTSSQAVQEKLLLVKEAFFFLKARHPALANQLQLAYIFTMKWYYTTRFAKYLYSLQKLKLKNIDLLFVLGGTNDHTEAKLGLFGYATAAATSVTGTVPKVTLAEYFLSVTKRMSILSEKSDLEARRAIPSQIAETTPFTYWLEFPFSQWSNAVLDNVIVEYLFMTDFFYQGNEKFNPVSELDPSATANYPKKDWSHVMFEEVYKMGNAFVNWLSTPGALQPSSLGSRIASGSGAAYAGGVPSLHGASCDSYAILLMIRMIQNQSYLLHNEFHVPAMDEYHNALLLKLWPQFTRIVDANCDAVKRNVSSHSSYSHSNEIKHAPITATQQFAQFLVGLLKLAFTHDDVDDKLAMFQGEPIVMSIVRLRNDFESALTKASNHVFGTGKSNSVQKEIFLFNNYFLIVTILKTEFEVGMNEFTKEQIQHFEMLCEAYRPK